MWMYEPSLFVPFIVRGPCVAKAGVVNDDLLSLVDLAPTLLELAGITPPDEMQGHTFRETIAGNQSCSRDAIFYHYYGQFGVPENYGVRTADYKLVFYPTLDPSHRWEFFDLKNDPEEMDNEYLSGDPSLIASIRDRLSALADEAHDPLPPDRSPGARQIPIDGD
jgi:arylsulfatase A-like enzyme